MTLSRRRSGRLWWCLPEWHTSSSTLAPGGCGRSTYTPATILLPSGSNDRGGSITFETSPTANRHVPTEQYNFNSGVGSEEGARVVTSVRPCVDRCNKVDAGRPV